MINVYSGMEVVMMILISEQLFLISAAALSPDESDAVHTSIKIKSTLVLIHIGFAFSASSINVSILYSGMALSSYSIIFLAILESSTISTFIITASYLCGNVISNLNTPSV